MKMNLSLLSIAPPIMWRWVWNRRLKADELRELQNKKLRGIIRHSYEYVPYYHTLFEEVNLDPDDVKTIEDLDKIPITSKSDVRDLPFEKIVASNIDLTKCWIERTSGTTGTPMTIYWEKKAKLVDQLLKYLWQLECGDKITNRQVVIGVGWVPESHSLQKIGIFRTKRISPFDDVKTQIEEIKRFDPRTMNAYPSCVSEIAKEIIEEDVQGINICLIFPGGETLDEYTRKLGEEAFNAEIFDHYGAIEVGRIYNECVIHKGYHTSAERVIVEIIRDGEAVSRGKEGEVTVTNFDNYAMPFIRYNLGDLGVLIGDDCSCGSCFPLMRLTAGRKKDMVELPDGRVVSVLAVISVLNNIQGIKQFQLIQEKTSHFLVKVVKGRMFVGETVGEVKQMLESVLDDIEIEVMIVDNIPRDKSGKFKPFITKVPVRYGNR